MTDEIRIHDDSGKPIRMAFSVSSARVQHYDDIVEYMVRAEVERCKTQDKFTPTNAQIDFLRKELVRYCVIRRNIDGAQKIRIRKSNILNEAN